MWGILLCGMDARRRLSTGRCDPSSLTYPWCTDHLWHIPIFRNHRGPVPLPANCPTPQVSCRRCCCTVDTGSDGSRTAAVYGSSASSCPYRQNSKSINHNRSSQMLSAPPTDHRPVLELLLSRAACWPRARRESVATALHWNIRRCRNHSSRRNCHPIRFHLLLFWLA